MPQMFAKQIVHIFHTYLNPTGLYLSRSYLSLWNSKLNSYFECSKRTKMEQQTEINVEEKYVENKVTRNSKCEKSCHSGFFSLGWQPKFGPFEKLSI